MRLGNKGAKSLEVRRIVLSVLHMVNPEYQVDVEEVLSRCGSLQGYPADRYLAVQQVLYYLGKHGLAISYKEPGFNRKWWSITDAGRAQIHEEHKQLEREAETLADIFASGATLPVPA
jgi:hypothetical protein